MNKFVISVLAIVACVFCVIPKTAQAVFTCDSGSTTTNCVVTTSKTMTNGEIITGTGDLTIANGGSLNLAGLTNVFGINMSGTTTVQSGGAIVGNFNATTTNFAVNFGGLVNVNGKGFAGGGTNSAGSGPGGGGTAAAACGAGYVSYGGRANSLICSGGGLYGSVISPSDFGSGGGGNGVGSGGAGGGAVKIVASGTVTINGLISANGSVGGGGATTGGGSGGSIWIQTNTLTGTGSTTANGGNGGNSNAGSASGGRIAITFSSDTSNLTMQTYGGTVGFEKAGAGTIYFGGGLIIANNNVANLGSILNASSYSFTSTTIKDQGILTLASPLTVFNGGSLNITSGTSTFNVPININTLPTFSSLNVSSGTNFAHSSATSSIHVYSLILNITGNATVSGSINVNSAGFLGGATNATGTGPGGGGTSGSACGGSYGGSGGLGQSSGCTQPPTYGSTIAPTNLGSGGGGNGLSGGGNGGCAVKLIVGGTLTLNGQITSNGGDGFGSSSTGGGSGGSIWIQADVMTGSGSLTANGGSGGNSIGGKGGGGRISIINNTDTSFIAAEVNVGSVGFVSAPPAGNGTINRSLIITVSSLTTSAANPVATSSATLNGIITNDGNASSTVEGFEYGPTISYGNTASTTGTFGVGSFSNQIFGLTPNTTYHFRSYATNSAGTGYGSDATFLTASITPPTLLTPSTNNVLSYTANALGNISDDGGFFNTVRGFEYGTTTQYGLIAQEAGIFNAGTYQLPLSNLICRTTYHLRAFARNTAGSASSSDATFLTGSCPPDVPTAVVATPQNGSASVTFTAPFNGGSPILRYIVTSSPGNIIVVGNPPPLIVSGLTNGTPYTFRVVAENDVGPSPTSTPSNSITPSTTPVIQTLPVTNITLTTADFNASSTNAGGSSITTRGFEYGTGISYGSILSEDGTFTAQDYSLSVTSLVCGTTYHVRAFSTNTAGTASSTDVSFATSACPPPVNNDSGGSSGGGSVYAPVTIIDNFGIRDDEQPPLGSMNPLPPFIRQPHTRPDVETTDSTTENPPIILSSGGSNDTTNSGGGSVSTSGGTSSGGGVIRSVISTFVYQPILNATAVIGKTVEGVMTNQIFTKTVIVGTAVTGVTASLPLLFSTPLSASELLFIPVRLWGLLLMGLGLRKRFKPWGTVYDSVTKMPVDPAYVVVRDMNRKVVAESLTDMDGRYGFLLEPGTYFISANKTHYAFPSRKLQRQENDEIYEDLYFGEPIEIDNNTIMNRNIPLDPLAFDWNEFEKNKRNLMSFHKKNERTKRIISSVLFRVGFFITLLATLYRPTLFNILMLVLYALVLGILTFGIKRKALGEIVDSQSKAPLSYSVIRVYSANGENLITTKIADAFGRYYCLVPQGKYIVVIENKNSDGSYTKIFTSSLLDASNGIINQSFKV